MSSNGKFKYETIIELITEMVDVGGLNEGMKLPSLRAISRQTQTSVTTALQAYGQLEDEGIIEARPQSGYYVSKRVELSLLRPETSNPSSNASHVAKSGAIHTLLRHASNPNLVPLGCAIPSTEVLASGRLDRFLSRAARTKGNSFNLYTEPKGDLGLRQELSRRSRLWGQAIPAENIAITAGCTEALFLALKCVTKPGDLVATESPTYFGLLQVIELLDLKVLELSTHAEHGVDLDALEHALDTQPVKVCLFSSSFNNPLGCIVPEDKKRSILAILRARSVPLIEDDVYGDIYFGDRRPKPYMALDVEADVTYCSSFSKTLAPGYRIGWIISNRRLQDIVEKKLALTLSGPALAQAALADYLRSGGFDAHLRRIRRLFEKTIDTMHKAIEAAFPVGTRVSRPTGGFVLWVELPRGVNTKILFEQALLRNICFVPGQAFSSSDYYDHCLRLSCGCFWSDEIAVAVNELGHMAQSMLPRTKAS